MTSENMPQAQSCVEDKSSKSSNSACAQSDTVLAEKRRSPLYSISVRLLVRVVQDHVARQLRTHLALWSRVLLLRPVPDACKHTECIRAPPSKSGQMTAEAAVQTSTDVAQQTEYISSPDGSEGTDRDSGAEPSSSSGRSSTQYQSSASSSYVANSPPSSNSSHTD